MAHAGDGGCCLGSTICDRDIEKCIMRRRAVLACRQLAQRAEDLGPRHAFSLHNSQELAASIHTMCLVDGGSETEDSKTAASIEGAIPGPLQDALSKIAHCRAQVSKLTFCASRKAWPFRNLTEL